MECLECQQRTIEWIKISIEECLECQQSLESRQKGCAKNQRIAGNGLNYFLEERAEGRRVRRGGETLEEREGGGARKVVTLEERGGAMRNM